MKRWDHETHKFSENERIDEFLNEIRILCVGFGFSLTHEDNQGAFVIEKYSESKMHKLLNASMDLTGDEHEKD